MRAAASFVTRRLQAASAAASGKRGMASHGSAHGKEYPFGMHFHVSPVHKNLGLAYGTMLWLWVFYRVKQDGRVVLVRFSPRPVSAGACASVDALGVCLSLHLVPVVF